MLILFIVIILHQFTISKQVLSVSMVVVNNITNLKLQVVNCTFFQFKSIADQELRRIRNMGREILTFMEYSSLPSPLKVCSYYLHNIFTY